MHNQIFSDYNKTFRTEKAQTGLASHETTQEREIPDIETDDELSVLLPIAAILYWHLHQNNMGELWLADTFSACKYFMITNQITRICSCEDRVVVQILQCHFSNNSPLLCNLTGMPRHPCFSMLSQHCCVSKLQYWMTVALEGQMIQSNTASRRQLIVPSVCAPRDVV